MITLLSTIIALLVFLLIWVYSKYRNEKDINNHMQACYTEYMMRKETK